MDKETLFAPGCKVEMLERFRKPNNADIVRGTIKKVVPGDPAFCYYIEFSSGAKGWYSKWDVMNKYVPIGM